MVTSLVIMKRYNYIVIIIFLFLQKNYCQQPTLLFNHLTVNNGLSAGVINCTYKDSKGYVWMSSFDGLNRFDGITCTIFRENLNTNESILGTMFLSIVEDLNSNLWIGSNKGLNVYYRKTNTFKNFQLPNRTVDEQTVSPFYIDNNNFIWVQSGALIFKFNTTTNTFVKVIDYNAVGKIEVNTVPQSLYKELETIYTVTNKLPNIQVHQFAKLNENSKVTFNNTITNIKCFLPVQNGFWIGTKTGLYYYNTITQNAKQVVENNTNSIGEIECLHINTKGVLWIGSLLKGLYMVDTRSKEIIGHYKSEGVEPFSLSGNQISNIKIDNDNNLWLSIWGKGLDYVHLDKFSFKNYLPKGKADLLKVTNFIRSIIQVNNNEFWCGTSSSGILVFDNNKTYKTRITNGLPNAIEHLYVDNMNNIWAATFVGLYVVNAHTKIVKKVELSNSTIANQFNFITQLKNNNLLASSNAGLFILKKNKGTYQSKLIKGLTNSDVYLTTFEDSKGKLYISKAFKGFAVGHLLNDSFALIKNFPYTASIKCFTELDNTVWIGTTIGLLKYNNTNINVEKIYTTENGLTNQYIYGVLLYNNSLWLSTNVGINQLNLLTEKINTYTTAEGLQSNEFNTYSFCKAANGEMLFGGVNGFNAFYPNEVKTNTYNAQIVLSNLQINDALPKKSYNYNEINTLELTQYENTVSFQFSVLNYNNSNTSNYYYKLEGYDKQWIKATNNATIRYANLPSGEYTLIAKTSNIENISSKYTHTLQLKVATPWHKTWWFVTLLIVSIVGIILLINRAYYLRKIEKQKAIVAQQIAIQDERNRIAADMHDDLGSGLTKITYLSQMAMQQTNKEDNLLKINKTSAELVENMSEIIWAMKEENNSVQDLILYIKKYTIEYCDNNNLECTIKQANVYENRIVKGENRRHIYLIVKELLHNIVKHAKAKQVIITVTITNTWQLTLIDDGVGINENAPLQTNGNGLKNIKKRVTSIGGNITFNNINKGTEVVIHIPI